MQKSAINVICSCSLPPQFGINDVNFQYIGTLFLHNSTYPRATQQGRVKYRCHVQFQWSQYREQSRRRADTKKTQKNTKFVYPMKLYFIILQEDKHAIQENPPKIPQGFSYFSMLQFFACFYTTIQLLSFIHNINCTRDNEKDQMQLKDTFIYVTSFVFHVT